MARLVSAEATISGLKKQVVGLGSSEALARVRESYSTAMAQAEDKHRQQLAQAMLETQRVKEEMEAKVNPSLLQACDKGSKSGHTFWIITCFDLINGGIEQIYQML